MALSPCREETTEVVASPEAVSSLSDSEDFCTTDPPESLSCTIYTPTTYPNGLSALAQEWNTLLSKSRFDTFFMSHEWQSIWWQQLGEGDLYILAFRTADEGELVGIVPLYRLWNEEGEWGGQHSLHLVGCVEVSDFLDILVVQGHEDSVYQGLLTWLLSDDAPRWDLLDLCNLPEDSLTYQRLPEIFGEAGVECHTFQEDVAPRILLPDSYERYLLEQVDKKQRHEIRRKQRRAEREAEVEFYIVGPEHDLQEELTDFLALQRQSRADKEEFMTPEMERFFRTMAQRMLDRDVLRLAFLKFDGRKAAALLAFEYKDQMLLYNSGYDTSDLAGLSPGWVLLAYLIQYSIVRGMRVFDFLQGDESYKYRFGSEDYRVMRTIAYRPQRESSR